MDQSESPEDVKMTKKLLAGINSAIARAKASCITSRETSVHVRHTRRAVESYKVAKEHANSLASTVEEHDLALHERVAHLQQLREMVANNYSSVQRNEDGHPLLLPISRSLNLKFTTFTTSVPVYHTQMLAHVNCLLEPVPTLLPTHTGVLLWLSSLLEYATKD
ncbi:hypothetical protein N7471_010883 [Penicillium samsonianum]|uniref:uncharacterized protein n=1 Tax=Penicillium samsonianum TaxID=1882272 RepID=UPI0025481ACD|nr:uncharacterized protein N7471_010883 [Penicillium samsonianum]KAJ6123566.1 hypothetical protein N7471_010883 [Penicillium samsonianum]